MQMFSVFFPPVELGIPKRVILATSIFSLLVIRIIIKKHHYLASLVYI